MGKQDKKLQKKRAREREVKERLRLRREAKRKKLKEAHEEAKEIAAYNKMIKERVQLEQWAKMVEGKIPEDLQERIQNNIQILKALEEDHAAELKAQKEAREAATLKKKDSLEAVFEESHASFAPAPTDFEPQT